MPTLTLTVTYDGNDPVILESFGRIGSALSGSTKQNTNNAGVQTSASLERIAQRFAGYVSRRSNLKKVMLTWLRQNGKIPLPDLVKASGVANQHDYAGIGSALTRNMKKSGGPKDWYDGAENANGDWIYEIADEFVGPLKRAFNL